MESAVRKIGSTRPTAYDLFKAIRYMKENNYDMNAARRYANEISGRCRKIGEYGNELIPENGKILTHCNAGGAWPSLTGGGLRLPRSGLQRWRARTRSCSWMRRGRGFRVPD